MKINIIQNVLQNVLTLNNRLCIAICLKFHQSNILVNTLATQAYKFLHIRKTPPPPPPLTPHRENGTQKEKLDHPKGEKRPPPPYKNEQKAPQIDCYSGGSGRGGGAGAY